MKLKKLNLRNTRVADLSPLAKMPLTYFDATAIPATDYSPLAGAPLEACLIQNSPLSDLSFLRDSPVKELTLFNCNEARGFAVLAGLKSLDLLILPQSFRELPEKELDAIGALRTHPTLKNIQTELRTGSFLINTAQSKDGFWRDWDLEQTFVPALRRRGLTFSLFKRAAGTYYLEIQNQPLRDLSILKGAPISELILVNCQVSDLTPIRDLPLEYLNIPYNPITDLGPLRGMQIKTLYLTSTKVSDLSPLTSLPLKELYLGSCDSVTDVAPLAEIPTLEKAVVPMQAVHIEALHKLRKLQMLAFQTTDGSPYFPDTTAEEFWKRWPGLTWTRALNETGMKYNAYQDSGGMWSITITAREFHDLSVLTGKNINRLILDHTSVSDLMPLVGLPLKFLSLDGTPVSNLTPLGGIALESLSLRETPVTDLSVLRRTPLCSALKSLWLYRTPVTDFAPVAACLALTIFDATDTTLPDLDSLRGFRLREVYFGNTRVRDISILAGMPLERAFIDGANITDVTPLLKCPALKDIILPKAAQNIEALRELPNLMRVSYAYDAKVSGPSTTTTDFWAKFDAAKKTKMPQP